jgi:hypothetical protein
MAMRQPPLALAASATIGLVVGVMQALRLVPTVDFHVYWRAGTELDALYAPSWLSTDPYVYPPPLAQVFGLLNLLPEPLVLAAWTTLLCIAVWHCAWQWAPLLLVAGVPAAALALPAIGSVAGYALLGNVQLIVAAAIVLAMQRWPAAWALVVLTKVAPGVGILWYAFRREWRPMGIAIAATAAVATASIALAPQAWLDFVAFAANNAATPSPVPVVPVPFPALAAGAVAIIWYGARTDRPWMVPIACGICSLALYEWSFLPIWIGAIALSRTPHSRVVPTVAVARMAARLHLAPHVVARPTATPGRPGAPAGPVVLPSG